VSVSRVDRILEVLDAGLQTPMPDPTYGEVSPRNAPECWRCLLRPPASDAGLCESCRERLRNDEAIVLPPDVAALLQSFAEALAPVVAQFEAAIRSFAEVIGPAIAADLGLLPELPHLNLPEMKSTLPLERLRHGTASVCPRHGPTRGGLCRRCRPPR
jgi:hypothetical protein